MGEGVSLTFREDIHEYRYGGVVVPSVTQILKPLVDYSHVPADALEKARQEGVAIHKTVELECKGDLDEDALPDWLRPYLSAWRKFVLEAGFVLEASEERVYHPGHHYAGTLDLRGATRNHKQAVIDIKRSFAAGPAIGVQTAAYANAIGWQKAARFGLQLRADGTYRLREFNDPTDRTVFLALLTVHRYRERNEA
jgi:L-ascorbate metabolism protein UlaG (beta-lactamase superfamily)